MNDYTELAQQPYDSDGKTSTELTELIKKKKIPNFVGFFTWDQLKLLPFDKNNWCAMLNQDSVKGEGTHWVGLYKKNDKVVYFDPFGQPPPTRLKELAHPSSFHFVEHAQQSFFDANCGERVVEFFEECFLRDNLKEFEKLGEKDPPDENIDFVALLKDHLHGNSKP